MRRCPLCARTFDEQTLYCDVHDLPLVAGQRPVRQRAGEFTGQVLDNRYLLLGVVGQGGMGVVYEAENLRIGQVCAVKVLNRALCADSKMRMRLFREVQSTSAIRHRNVVQILDYGRESPVGDYLVMEFLEGETLASMVKADGAMPLATVLRVATQVASGLAATHHHGLIHRDLKPNNVAILPDGTVKLFDFGLVKHYEPSMADEVNTLTSQGQMFGTPWYMSPEQASMQHLDQRSDIYSLGVMLYEMLTGKLPFGDPNPVAVMDAHRRQPVPLPQSLEPPVDLPPSVELFLLKMLNKSPDRRHQSMVEILADLYNIAEELQVSLVRQPDEPEARAKAKRGQSQSYLPTMPIVGDVAPLDELATILRDNVPELTAQLAEAVRDSMPRYSSVESGALERGVRLLLEMLIKVVEADGPLTEIPEELKRWMQRRSEQKFSPIELIAAIWLGLTLLRPLYRATAGNDLSRYFELEKLVDQRALPFAFRLGDYYISQASHQLTRAREALARRNEELQRVRAELVEQLDSSSRARAKSERLHRWVAELVPSGLAFLERDGPVLLFNAAMERITGLTAEQVVGRPYQQVLRFFGGLPADEFAEQAREQGEIGLRKLRLRVPAGERTVYIRGRSFHDSSGARIGTLFVVDDITQREQLLARLRAHLPRRVINTLVEQADPQPLTLQLEGAVLVVRLVVDAATPEGAGATDTTADTEAARGKRRLDRLSQTIGCVAAAASSNGGSIEMADDATMTVSFTGFDAQRDAIAAMRALREARADLAGGAALGQLAALDAGDERWFVHRLEGRCVELARALATAADPGTFLLGDFDSEDLADGPTIETTHGTITTRTL